MASSDEESFGVPADDSSDEDNTELDSTSGRGSADEESFGVSADEDNEYAPDGEEIVVEEIMMVPNATPHKYKGHVPVLVNDELEVTNHTRDGHTVSDSTMEVWRRANDAKRKIWSVSILRYTAADI